MAATLRWGILGAARIARDQVIPAIQRSRNGRVVAIASRDEARARDAAHEGGVPRAHGSYQALLDDPEVAAVYVPLPNSLHREWTIRAAEAGKHVLCEKPLAADAAGAAAMLSACREHGVLLMEAFMYRFHPRTQDVARLVRSGVVGEPRIARATFTYRLRARADIRLSADLAGGALMDVGCYAVSACRMVLGEPIAAHAVSHDAAGGVDETLAGVLRFEGGAVGLVSCSMDALREQWYEIHGTEGVLRVPHAFRVDWGEPVIEIRRGAEVERREYPVVNQYALMVEAFADAVLSGRPAPLPPEDALANMRAIDALRAAARPPAAGG